MYFSTIDVRPAIRDDRARFDLLRAADNHHGFIWSLFENDANQERDFIYRVDDEDTPPRFTVISTRRPTEHPGLTILTKEFNPQLRSDDRLAFRTRVNPVIQRSRGRHLNSAKHDVAMDAKFQRNEDSNQSEYARVHQAVSAWFSQRGEAHGFSIVENSFEVSDYRQHRIHRPSGRAPLRFSSVDCQGVLVINDAKKAIDFALHGLGSARAFGCGLVLLRRAK